MRQCENAAAAMNCGSDGWCGPEGPNQEGKSLEVALENAFGEKNWQIKLFLLDPIANVRIIPTWF